MRTRRRRADLTMNAARWLITAAWAGLFACCGLADERQADDLWRAFRLRTVRVNGLTVRYEEPLAARMPAIRARLSKFLSEQAERFAQLDLLRAKSDAIVDDVNKIVGLAPTPEQRAEQREIISWFLGAGARLAALGGKTALYLVTRRSIKDHLRQGGKLPGFTYDKSKDEAAYEFAYRRRSGTGAPRHYGPASGRVASARRARRQSVGSTLPDR